MNNTNNIQERINKLLERSVSELKKGNRDRYIKFKTEAERLYERFGLRRVR